MIMFLIELICWPLLHFVNSTGSGWMLLKKLLVTLLRNAFLPNTFTFESIDVKKHVHPDACSWILWEIKFYFMHCSKVSKNLNYQIKSLLIRLYLVSGLPQCLTKSFVQEAHFSNWVQQNTTIDLIIYSCSTNTNISNYVYIC